jgi:hypothetical protein
VGTKKSVAHSDIRSPWRIFIGKQVNSHGAVQNDDAGDAVPELE